ncbi:MAG: peptide deformylase [Phyllobacterium sp.]
MPIRPIVRFPDPSLRNRADAIEAFDDALQALAGDLLDTMRAAPGIGITACHIGVPKRLVIIELPDRSGVRTFVNPRIEWASDEISRYEEGSVSMPGVTEIIERPSAVRFGFEDMAGGTHTEEANGLLAVCVQHEIDQLDGIFWVDRLSKLKRDRIIKRFNKMQRIA